MHLESPPKRKKVEKKSRKDFDKTTGNFTHDSVIKCAPTSPFILLLKLLPQTPENFRITNKPP